MNRQPRARCTATSISGRLVVMTESHDNLAEEWVEVVEPTGERLGRATRTSVHAAGQWHEVFHCLVVRSGAPARVVLQRRRWSSRAFPGMLDLSVTGHLSAGEQPLDGVREIEEEIGLRVDASRLVSLGRRLLADDGGEGRNREIAHVYLLTDDTPLEALRVDPDHVSGLVEVTVSDLVSLLADAAASVPIVEVDAQGVMRASTCTGAELVPSVDGYWAVLAIMAERLVAGLSPLAI